MSSQVTVTTGAKRARAASTGSRKKSKSPTRGFKVAYPRNNIIRMGRTFPEKLRATLRYSDINSSYASSAGSYIATMIYKCNSCYDPYYPVGGHQPYGFDQYMAVYNHFSVIKSFIKVTFQQQNDTSNFPGVVGINYDDDGTDASTPSTRIEKTGRKNYGVVGANATQVVLYDKWTCKQKFGASAMALDKNIGTIAADPSEVCTWFIWYANNGATTGYMQVVVDIEYDVEFTELKDFGAS